MPENRRTTMVWIAVACLLVGVAAGAKMAELERENIGRINVTVDTTSTKLRPETKPPVISKNFYKPLDTKPETVKPKIVEKPSVAPPSDGVSAEAYIVGNLTTGDVYLERNADTVLPFASMSKLITALVATNVYSPHSTITIDEQAATVGSDITRIGPGETFTMHELLHPLLLSSSNMAAEALASSAGTTTDRSEFLKLMNDYSWEIGMPRAFFADPSGLDSHNAGTARGFLAMAQYLYKSRPDILSITRVASTTFATTTDHGSHNIVNIHPYVTDMRFLGGKTGYTKMAMYTMLTILKIREDPIAFVVLRSKDRAKDTALLVDKLAEKMN